MKKGKLALGKLNSYKLLFIIKYLRIFYGNYRNSLCKLFTFNWINSLIIKQFVSVLSMVFIKLGLSDILLRYYKCTRTEQELMSQNKGNALLLKEEYRNLNILIYYFDCRRFIAQKAVEKKFLNFFYNILKSLETTVRYKSS